MSLKDYGGFPWLLGQLIDTMYQYTLLEDWQLISTTTKVGTVLIWSLMQNKVVCMLKLEFQEEQMMPEHLGVLIYFHMPNMMNCFQNYTAALKIHRFPLYMLEDSAFQLELYLVKPVSHQTRNATQMYYNERHSRP